jgi:excisionase family DNA binding protein
MKMPSARESQAMWITVKELSEYLRIKEKTLYYLVQRGQIPHYRVNKIILFKRQEIDTWMEGNRAVAPGKSFAKISRSFYTGNEGKPDHLEERKVVSS